MMSILQLLQIILFVVVILLSFGIGLSLQIADFSRFVKTPKPIITGLFGQIIILPAVAAILAISFDLPPELSIGIVIISCCPGGPASNLFTFLAKGDVALSVSLTGCSSIITIFTIPIVLKLAFAYFGVSGQNSFHIDALPIFLKLIVLILIPITIGMLLRHKKSDWAQKLQKPLIKILFVIILKLIILYAYQVKDILINYLYPLAIVIPLLFLITMSLGAVLTYISRLNPKERKAVIIEICFQNASQAIVIASGIFLLKGERFIAPVFFYGVFMFFVTLLYLAGMKLFNSNYFLNIFNKNKNTGLYKTPSYDDN